MVYTGTKQMVYEPKEDHYISYNHFKEFYLNDNDYVDGRSVFWAELWLVSGSARRFSRRQKWWLLWRR